MNNIKTNTTDLQTLLNKVNELPDSNAGATLTGATITPDTVFLNEVGYANGGEKIIGTFTIEDELNTQAQLLDEINTVLSTKTVVNLQEKTVTPTTESQIIVPDEGYDGLSKVTVGASAVETCTVTFPESFTYSSPICYLGSDFTSQSVNLGNPLTIEVIKNSILVIDDDNLRFNARSGLYSDELVSYIGPATSTPGNSLGVIITRDATFHFTGGSEIT